MITAATETTSGSTARQFIEVGSCDLLQVIAQFPSELGDVPEHITEFELDRLAGLHIEIAIAIPQHFLDFVGNLPGLTCEPESWINRIATNVGVTRCAPCRLLIGVEFHNKGGETPGW